MKSHPELPLLTDPHATPPVGKILSGWALVGLLGVGLLQLTDHASVPTWSLGSLGLCGIAGFVHIVRAHAQARWNAALDAFAQREIARQVGRRSPQWRESEVAVNS